ncbi:CGNR zinc finger domain-containing protein [Streptomyces violascens]|uniref:CGNR zinc finger domain-containing protein n=1 Tax=Streptomyces violascens TaxID=67381 RepID=UPI003660FF35
MALPFPLQKDNLTPPFTDPRPLPGQPFCLDLVNTRYTAPTGRHDLIDTRAALNRWMATSPHVEDYPDLYRFADGYTHTTVRAARDVLAHPYAPKALEPFNTLLSRARPRRELVLRGIEHRLDIDDPAHLVGYLAADDYLTLLAECPDWIRTCENGCGLYFYSRNPRRRRCAHSACGNRVRATRHRLTCTNATSPRRP